MTRDRISILVVGVILLVNAAVILVAANGQIEGYVGGIICVLAGILNIAFAVHHRRREQQHVGKNQAEWSGE